VDLHSYERLIAEPEYPVVGRSIAVLSFHLKREAFLHLRRFASPISRQAVFLLPMFLRYGPRLASQQTIWCVHVVACGADALRTD
jgi:hypothetical protein